MPLDHDSTNRHEPFCVDEFLAEDAEGIASLFRGVYGEGSPNRLFYDPEAVTAANRDGRYVFIVARTGSGKVVGASRLTRSAPCPCLYETVVGPVLKDYRKTGAGKKMLAYLCEDYVPQHPHIEELFWDTACSDVSMQKMITSSGFKETAIEAASMPGETSAEGLILAGRVAALDAFRCYIPQPHRIYLPPIYAAVLRRIYERLGDVRDIALSDQIFPGDRMTFAELSVLNSARVARIAVHKSGCDFQDGLAHLENQARSQNAVVFQAWLNLTEPWVGYAVEILRERGYFFGGALPRWFDGDGLLMQKVECPPDFDKILLWSDFSKELLDFIQQDWECTAA